MNNKWINSFMTVAQQGSINAAARSLYISPQALLQQINLLEQEVGAKLFIRQRSGMSLTLAGKEFLQGAQQIETVYATTLSRCRLAQHAEDTIRIPMMSSIVLPEMMEKICARYRREVPRALRTEFITDEDFDGWMDGLRNLKYDLIEHYALDGRVPQGIHFEYLSGVPSWCVMSDYHPLADRKVLRPEDLDGQLLLSPASNLKLSGYFGMYVTAADIKVKVEPIANDRYQIIDGLNRGGIYFADENIARIFVGYHSAPLDFDNHVQHGLACREDMVETYQPLFDIALNCNSEMKSGTAAGET